MCTNQGDSSDDDPHIKSFVTNGSIASCSSDNGNKDDFAERSSISSEECMRSLKSRKELTVLLCNGELSLHNDGILQSSFYCWGKKDKLILFGSN